MREVRCERIFLHAHKVKGGRDSDQGRGHISGAARLEESCARRRASTYRATAYFWEGLKQSSR
jgi:hypothetical protein